MVDGTVVVGMVGGGGTVVDGTNVDVVGGCRVVVGSGRGTSVVAVVVCTGGEVAGGGVVPVEAGRVVATGGWVEPAPPATGGGAGAVVVLESTEVEVGGDDVVGPRTMVLGDLRVVVGCAVVGA